jgi:class 3 adenylate cyclase
MPEARSTAKRTSPGGIVGPMSPSCARCGAPAAPDARFCAACGAPLESPGDAERKLATLVFADLVGSTELVAARDPEDARGLLEPFFEIARATLEEHGGRVEKFIGDAVVAVFGVPRAYGDDPDRAVAAATALVGRLRTDADGLEVRVGIETGEVLATSVAGDLAVTGGPSHAAARLQQAAAPGEILVGARAAAACRTAALDGPHEYAAKGFAEPLRAWRALGREATTEGTAPFLGRGGELEALRLAYLRAVRERAPRLTLIAGEAGLGKTRLARELLAVLEREEPAPRVLIGRNPPYGGGIAFWALGELLRGAAEAPADADADAVRTALAARLDALGAANGPATADTLAGSLGATGHGADAIELARAWRRLLATLAVERPLVIVVEDVHWADEGFLDLLEQSLTLPGCPLLVICTARPEIDGHRPELGLADGHERIGLGPLRAAAAEELVAQLVPGADPQLSRRIAETSAGNPFFAEEIAHAVTTDAAPSAAPLPDTVQAAIAARLDALPEAEKRTLQLAAVLGERFTIDALGELLEAPPRDALAELERRHLVSERSPGNYRFHHQLIRDVGYASLTRAERVDLHERAAGYLHAGADGRIAELGELIAFHLACAAELDGGPERAAVAFDAVTGASEIALKRGAAARAQELLEQAARFAPDASTACEALGEAAEIAMSRMRGDESYRLLREKAAIAERSGDRNNAACALAVAVEVTTRMSGLSGQRPEAELERTIAEARALGDPADEGLRAQLLLDEAWMMWSFDHPERMAVTAAAAVEIARRHGVPALLSSALDAASAAAWVERRYEDAVEHSRERVELLDSEADAGGFLAFERSDAFSMLTDAHVRAGNLREAARWLEVNIAEIADSAPHVAGVLGLQVLYMLGEWDAALVRSAGVRASWIEAGRPPFTFFGPPLACVAAIHGIRGEEAAERDWLEFAFEVVADNQVQIPGVRLWAADAALHRADHERALELLVPTQDERRLATTSAWADQTFAKRAEALVLAGDPGAADAVELAAERHAGDAHARAVVVRAQGLLTADDALLGQAAERFAATELAYELARTQWLRGGEHRAAAEAGFERLGAVRPG